MNPVARAFRGILLASLVVTVLGLLNPLFWPLEFLCHFTILHLALCGAGLMVLLYQQDFRWAIVALASLLLNGYALLPLLEILPPPPAPPGSHRIKVVQLNAFEWNLANDSVAQFLKVEDPDFVTFQEFNPALEHSLYIAGLNNRYPHRYKAEGIKEGQTVKLAVYSKHPATGIETSRNAQGEHPILAITFILQGQPVHLLTLHTNHHPQHQQQLLGRIVRHQHRYEPGLIVTGDFNASPWAWTIEQFRLNSYLQDTQRGFGFQPTWPGPAPVLPIDYVWTGEPWVVLNRRTGPFVGSDHLPVVVELALPAPASTNPKYTGKG